jgi:hypothetical protein
LPEAPDIEAKAVEIVSEKIEKKPTGSQNWKKVPLLKLTKNEKRSIILL